MTALATHLRWTHWCYLTTRFFEKQAKPPSAIETTIGNFIAEMVEDGATLQTGIGGIPDATLHALKGHKNLGMHSEMFSDGIIELVQCGALTGTNKLQAERQDCRRILPGVEGFV